jgi:hypothetical protein
MRMQMGPAKRAGSLKLVFDRHLGMENVAWRGDGAIAISIAANGIYDNSTYSYTIELSPEELRFLLSEAATRPRS